MALELKALSWELGCKPVNTTIECNQTLGNVLEDARVDKGNNQRLIGKLIYLSHTRLNRTYTISVVRQFMHTLKTHILGTCIESYNT